MVWECDRCGQVHTRNPTECRSCGHRLLASVSDAELQSRSEGRDDPEPLELGSRSPGSPPEDDLYSGPDTAPDGSLIRPGDSDERTEREVGLLNRFGWRLSSRLEVYSARPTALLVDAIRMLVVAAILLAVWFVGDSVPLSQFRTTTGLSRAAPRRPTSRRGVAESGRCRSAPAAGRYRPRRPRRGPSAGDRW